MEQKSPEKKEELVKSAVSLREEEILAFWQKEKIFEKSQEGKDHLEEFVFYDGPPFATGLPHYGHLIGGTMKDALPRYQTMRGKRVTRRWGWDCHGLPLENLIEKELGLKTKKDIEEYGIGKFNAAAKAAVLRYADEWKKIVPRLGRWVDMENDYKTMDSSYTETIWWMFKSLNDKKLVEKGFKSMHLCPRCETTLANFEVNQGYRDIADISAYAKFELKDEPGTFVLAWTTTPWTLPGNVALAVNSEIQYVKAKAGNEFYIFAESRLEALEKFLKDGAKFELVKHLTSSDLEGKAYEPLYPYYKDMKMTHPDRAWKIYTAQFVTEEDGTGVVHIAPAFGSDDLALARTHHLPLIQHVGMNGFFKREVTDFSGAVKPKDTPEDKDAHQRADIEVIKNLAHRGLLFAKEKFIHSYPHCWRCETPLLNYATTSWFVKVPTIKEKLLEENKKINWVPKEIGENRFGKWLEGSPDWAVSRSRYWGAPLPVWICHSCEKTEVFGSLEELKKRTSCGTEFFLMRHGEGEHNVQNVMSSGLKSPHHLTENGRKRAEKSALAIKEKEIDVIIASPLLRTRETAEIAARNLGIAPEKIVFDERLREVEFGDWNGKNIELYRGTGYFKDTADKFARPVPGGESLADIRKRVGEFMYEANEKYAGKKILVVAHETPLWLMLANIDGLDQKETIALRNDKPDFIPTASVWETAFAPIPHNELYELDFHRPFIDMVKLSCGCMNDGVHSDEKHGLMERVPEVFDCWFESGSMPYGQQHYMGMPLPKFDPEKNVGFPADFIAEGLDQTRGWFYSMLVLGVALFGKSPYKNVAVNGLILAEDGRKMSKSLKNYPDPMDVVSKYGADALRYYLLSSPATHAEDLNFSEKSVDGIYKKLILRLGNVVSFYELYADKNLAPSADSTHTLDRWMLSRLSELREEVTKNMEKYEIDKALRPFDLFVDDLSTWYVRRSRDRFKSENAADRNAALATTRFVLLELAKLLAPFTPFIAEDIYMKVKPAEGLPAMPGQAGQAGKESVHLDHWPKEMKCDEALVEDMRAVRAAVTLGLEARMKANIKVRQPLAKLSLRSEALKGKKDYLALIEDEVNVKEIGFDANLATDAELDTALTPALKEEGEMRELIRAIQDARKEAKLEAKDRVKLVASVSEEQANLLKKFDAEIRAVCNLSAIEIHPEKVEKALFSFM